VAGEVARLYYDAPFVSQAGQRRTLFEPIISANAVGHPRPVTAKLLFSGWLFAPSYKNAGLSVNARAKAGIGQILFAGVESFSANGVAPDPLAQINFAEALGFAVDASPSEASATISFSLPVELAVLAAAAPPDAHIVFGVDAAVWRGVSSVACTGWQRGANHRHRLASSYQQPNKARTLTAVPWQRGARLGRQACASHAEATRLRVRSCGGWTQGDDVLTAWRLGHEYGVPVHQQRDTGWVEGGDILFAQRDSWIVLFRDARPVQRSPWQIAKTLPPVRWWHDWRPGVWSLRSYCSSWQEGRDVYGWGWDRYIPPVIPVEPDPYDGCYTPPPGGAVPFHLWESLGITDPLDVRLKFVCEASWGGNSLVIIPILKVYLTMDSASLCLLPLCTNVHVLSMTIATDADSWAWTFSAELPVTELAKVSPVNGDPAEVRATINGVQWEFVVEEISRSREFGKATLSIRGRSRTAYLAAPYAAQQTWNPAVDTLAYQLAQDALPYGYGLDWTLGMDGYNEWLVTAGAWSFAGTPLEAVLDIASAVEAVVQSHKTDERLIVGSRYPVAPWAWSVATPDYAIPLDVIRQEGMEWTEKPKYNRVFVSGETQGLVAQVTRALSAGDVIAPMAVHKAITHQYAAHERGLAILANTGRQALVSMETALIPSLGLDVILPGKLVQIGDTGEGNWRGLVRGVEIVAGRPKVTQKIEIERHYL
jgi:hypothetical protein